MRRTRLLTTVILLARHRAAVARPAAGPVAGDHLFGVDGPVSLGQMTQAFRNIVNMLHGVRDGLIRDANNYEQQEQASQQILSS
jgi:hypothetical protein